ncbi:MULTISPECIES: hypothetical protein [unclassified Arsukibacterium]|uniref:hypothetical protein n=1 Tax=unclassified Arsukibacterium TaxID=2635278 RepID=UPI0025BFB451|nr:MULTISPECIES: hypothetical protein [unclassified Arsukibacterium]|tara:strand:- start:688 stop:1158 length:471 start_codon:yes stop_codon:yes gene_type:complete
MFRVLVLFFTALISGNALAGMKLQLFYDEEITIPEYCYFISRGGHENDFTCPVQGDRFRGISFPLVEDEIKRFTSKSKDDWNKDFLDRNLNTSVIDERRDTIDDRTHLMRVWQMEDIIFHLYIVCDKRACISINATEEGFVRDLVEQFSSRVLYDK